MILDFGLMTDITDGQKYGMIEAIAHLINRDYAEIGADFVNLDFIPQGTAIRGRPCIFLSPSIHVLFVFAFFCGRSKMIDF